MKKNTVKFTLKNCLRFRQVSAVISTIILTALPIQSFAGNTDTLETLTENYIERPDLGPFPKRTPASYAPSDEVQVVPYSTELWLENLAVDDDAGVMREMRTDMEQWRERELFVEQWDITPIEIYGTPDQGWKKRYVSQRMLRYIDKRITGEIKKSDKGSTLHAVGNVKKALRPQTEAKISKDISLKFRAKLLRGRLFMIVKNPYVESQAEISASGRAQFQVSKTFKEIGFRAFSEYRITDGNWVAWFDQDINGPLRARVSSEQDTSSMAFTGNSNQTFQLYFNYNF